MSDEEAPEQFGSPASDAQEIVEPVVENEQPQVEEPVQDSEEEEEQVADNNNNDDDDDDDDDFNDDNNITKDALDDDDLAQIKTSKRSVDPTQSSSESQQPHRFQRQSQQSNVEEETHYNSNEPFDAANKRRQELEAKMERALKKPKIKKRKDEHDLTNDEDEVIQILKRQMDVAAKNDSELISQKDENEGQSNDINTKIAINKIQLLPKVEEILSKANLSEVILDNNLLAEIRQWLEPLPDASLPSYEIQKVLFSALLKLPINTNHLRESGIGKILLFYQKSKRVEPKIKRIADKLISDWTRPIIGASDNYRDKLIHSVDFDSLRFAKSRQRSTSNATGNSKKPKEEKSIYEQQAARRNRAAAPVPTVTDYKFAPKSKIDKSQSQMLNAGVGTSLNRDDQFKRINQKLSGRKTASRKGGVSVEGRSQF